MVFAEGSVVGFTALSHYQTRLDANVTYTEQFSSIVLRQLSMIFEALIFFWNLFIVSCN